MCLRCVICVNEIPENLFKILLSRQLRRIKFKPFVRVHLINAQNDGETDGVIDSIGHDHMTCSNMTANSQRTTPVSGNSYFRRLHDKRNSSRSIIDGDRSQTRETFFLSREPPNNSFERTLRWRKIAATGIVGAWPISIPAIETFIQNKSN